MSMDERPDVIRYRQEVFFLVFNEIRHVSMSWDEKMIMPQISLPDRSLWFLLHIMH